MVFFIEDAFHGSPFREYHEMLLILLDKLQSSFFFYFGLPDSVLLTHYRLALVILLGVRKSFFLSLSQAS